MTTPPKNVLQALDQLRAAAVVALEYIREDVERGTAFDHIIEQLATAIEDADLTLAARHGRNTKRGWCVDCRTVHVKVGQGKQVPRPVAGTVRFEQAPTIGYVVMDVLCMPCYNKRQKHYIE